MQVIPFNLLAEQSVLGAMLISKEAVEKAAQMGLRAADFHVPSNGAVFEAIIELFMADAPLDITTVQSQLEKRGTFEQVGGLPYLVELANSVVTSVNLPYHAQIVQEKAMRRRIIAASEAIAKASYSQEGEASEILDMAEQRIFEILENRDLEGFTYLSEAIESNYKQLERVREGGAVDDSIMTQFSSLDSILHGLHKANLVLIAARPAMGKTSFALNLAINAAKSEVPTAFFSLEMSRGELANRLWSMDSMVELTKIQKVDLDDDEWRQLIDTKKELASVPIYIDDSGSVTVAEMRAKCRRLKREKGLGLVIIDHMQLMQSARRTDNRQQEVAEISRTLKLLAKDLDVPVVVLSQLNRNPEGRAKNRPALSDLRESGAIEQDADLVLMLYREDYYDPQTARPNIAECIIAKHRNGPTGMVELRWLPQFTTFRVLDKAHEVE